ncbi:unnamed protein product [Choristocarpus tenellus]
METLSRGSRIPSPGNAREWPWIRRGLICLTFVVLSVLVAGGVWAGDRQGDTLPTLSDAIDLDLDSPALGKKVGRPREDSTFLPSAMDQLQTEEVQIGTRKVQAMNGENDPEAHPQLDVKEEKISISNTVQFPSPGGLAAEVWTICSTLREDVLKKWGREYDQTLFSGAMVFGEEAEEVIINKMLTAILQQREFVISFTGISNTAGHDSTFEESYPMLFKDHLAKAMALTGVTLKVRNVAMGNNPVSPYSYCVEAHAGDDADIVTWEMGMMVAFSKCGRATPLVELFVRSALSMPKQPAVLFLNCLPSQDGCVPQERTPNILKRISLELPKFLGDCPGLPEESLLSVYGQFGLHYLNVRKLVLGNTCGDPRYSEFKLYKEGKVPGTKHMPWHPGPGGHALTAAILSQHYLALLQKAVLRLDNASPGVTVADLSWDNSVPEGGNVGEGEEREDKRAAILKMLGLTGDVYGHHEGDVKEGKRDSGGVDEGRHEGKRHRYLMDDVAVGKGDSVGGNRQHMHDSVGRVSSEITRMASEAGSDTEMSMVAGGPLPLPPPAHCKGYYFCDHPFHRCATSFVPISNPRWNLRTMVVGAGPSGFPLPNITFEYKTRLPKEASGVDISAIMAAASAPPSPLEWAMVLNEDKVNGFVPLGPPLQRGKSYPKDRKWTFAGGKEAGPIRFEFETTGGETGGFGSSGYDGEANNKDELENLKEPAGGWGNLVTVCHPHFVPRANFRNPSEVRFELDGKEAEVVEVPLQGPRGGPPDLIRFCVSLGTRVGPGKHILSVIPLVDQPLTAVSHVLYPA